MKKGYGEGIDLKEEARLQGLGLGSTDKRKDAKSEREEELLVRELEREDDKNPAAPFELPEPEGLSGLDLEDRVDNDASSSAGGGLSSSAYAPYRTISPSSFPLPTSPPAPAYPDTNPLILPPREIPPQPPLLLVPFTHPFGVRQWPAKALHFFNHRTEVRIGGDLALALLVAPTRYITPPVARDDLNNLVGTLDLNFVDSVRRGQEKDAILETGLRTGSPDLDFLAEYDEHPTHFLGSYRALPKNHEFRARDYYKELEPRLAKARELAGGRAPTSAEEKNPPKMESELRKERVDKEMRWRWELEGWAVVRSGSGVAWDEKWSVRDGGVSPFRILQPISEGDKLELRRAKERWEAEKHANEQALRDAGLL